MEEFVPLSLYLWTRIRQLGVGSIMGVPGDMNLELLDYIDEVKGLSWVGNANELNAAYAADGYARIKGCPGVLVTTMGVGELSALNGVAGAYTEQVKLIHIVGTTSTHAQANRLMIHHSLGSDPDHRVYERISAHVRCAHAWLDNSDTATAEIDRVIRECMIQSLPVYIFVPMDFVHVFVPSRRLGTAIECRPSISMEDHQKAVANIIAAVTTARRPVILVDSLASRFGAKEETRQLVDILGFPVFSTPAGKSIVDETHPKYCGIYNGEVSYPGVKTAVESSDCILNIGPLLSDSNTGGHTRDIRSEQVILLHGSFCTVFGTTYQNVYLAPLLEELSVTCREVQISQAPVPLLPPIQEPEDAASEEIVQSWIWKRLGDFTRPGDILIAESGTAQFGFPDAKFAAGVTYVTQLYFGSIGYSVGCCLGAAIAQKETIAEGGGLSNGRTILVVGDGSLQLTVQEIGTMVRLGLNPIIIIINNNGYTIERAIHGPGRAYNDISPWRHQVLLDVFGADNPHERSRKVRTKHEMEMVLNFPQYVSPSAIQLLEVFMNKLDIPWRLRNQIAGINRRAMQRNTSSAS